MNIVYKCSLAKLPGGLRLVKRAAKRANFDGTIVVKCNGEDRMSRKEHIENDMFLGGLQNHNVIILYRNTSHSPRFHSVAPFSLSQRTPREAYRTLLHELGHYTREVSGKKNEALYSLDPKPEERAADYYADKEIEILWPQ